MKKLFILFLLFKSYSSYSQFASFEHAQILEKGRVGIIGSYSVYRGYSGSRSYTTNTSTGIQLGIGCSKNVDFKVRYERIFSTYYGDDLNYLGVKGKFAFKKNSHFVFVLPIGIFFEDKEFSELYFSLSPQLLGTINLSQNINLSVGTNCIAILTSDGF
jgi:hypothetical protein